MGGPAKKVKAAFKTPEEGKKMSAVVKDRIEMKDEDFEKKYPPKKIKTQAENKIDTKRKGRRKTIKTSSTGLNEDEETLKKTLLG